MDDKLRTLLDPVARHFAAGKMKLHRLEVEDFMPAALGLYVDIDLQISEALYMGGDGSTTEQEAQRFVVERSWDYMPPLSITAPTERSNDA